MIDILIAEDEPAILESLNFILGRCGWIVDSVRDGEEALDAVRRHKPRLLLLDIMLPKRSGLDVLKSMRADPRLNHIPVLILTARGQQHDRQLAQELKADSFVTKPYSNEEVIREVRRLLDRG
ncbi:MAG TPA: response regulator [Hyphomicrobiaceae bacterium]|jgi:DNA-binding response OmpR family regulator